jgi:hypothetical protein
MGGEPNLVSLSWLVERDVFHHVARRGGEGRELDALFREQPVTTERRTRRHLVG